MKNFIQTHVVFFFKLKMFLIAVYEGHISVCYKHEKEGVVELSIQRIYTKSGWSRQRDTDEN